jgi:succinate-semialdehyde dehydrogenase/glutarate-semialdehyde dehydrogenase
MAIASINPTTGATLQVFEEHSDQEIEEKLALAQSAFVRHQRTSFEERAEKLRKAADMLAREKRAFAQLMTEEMGKTIKSAEEEADKCARACRHYADHGASYLRDEAVATEASTSYVRYLPIGPVLAIMPWNFPFWQVVRFVAPALMAGNVGLLKHASNVPRCAIALEDLFREAGFERGVFQTLLIGSSKVAKVIEDRRIRAVTLTGSEGAGREVAQSAGKALKKTVLELGGSDPFIVMPSADIAQAARTAVTARNLNNGQSCIAAKRFIIHSDVYDDFVRAFVSALRSLRVGDPMRDDTDIGPLATAAGLTQLTEQVERSVALGAKLLSGGQKLPARGNFYAPSALTDIPEAAPVYRDEVFGPVALLFRVRSLDEAIALANDSPFGLGSSVWTSDSEERERCVNELEAGLTFVNAMVASDPRLPFGGVKHSGYGRELGSFGIREFVNIKTVYIRESASAELSRSE